MGCFLSFLECFDFQDDYDDRLTYDSTGHSVDPRPPPKTEIRRKTNNRIEYTYDGQVLFDVEI